MKPFLLDAWLDTYEHGIEFNLAASTGPIWTANQLLDLGGEQARERYLNHKVVYSRPAGADTLREAIAEMQGVNVDCVQVVTGRIRSVDRSYVARHRENNFQIDLDEIMSLADSRTKLILVNSPHNPTGATMSDAEMEALHEFASQRGIQLASDEVYHPIYHGRETQFAARLPHATVINDLSKAFPLAGTRAGWRIERDARRREQYWTARAYFSVCNNTPGEILAEIAVRNHAVVLNKTQEGASRNLQRLDRFMAAHSDVFGWIRPQGGMTGFPWLVSGAHTRP